MISSIIYVESKKGHKLKAIETDKRVVHGGAHCTVCLLIWAAKHVLHGNKNKTYRGTI